MKILQVIPYFCFGGAETMCENLTYALKKLGHEVTVVSLYGEHTPISERMEQEGVKILYLDESGTPVSTQRTAELEIHTPLHPEAARAVCAPVIVHHGPQRCEIRIPVDFFLYRTELTRLDSVSAAELLPAEGGERPSVVLRRTEKGESLWEIAKVYRTAPAVIESANHLEQGAPLSEGMLLIPRVRT